MNEDQIERLRATIRESIKVAATDATALARSIGRGKDYVRDFLDGRKNTLPLEVIMQIEKILGVEDNYISRNVLNISLGNQILVQDKAAIQGDNKFDRVYNMPVYRFKDAFDGTMFWNSDSVYSVKMPFFLETHINGYGVIIEGDSMEPAYEAGDMIFVATELGLRKNTDVLVSTDVVRRDGDLVRDEMKAAVRRLRSYDAETLVVESFNPPKTEALSRSQWVSVERIVGKLSRS